MNQPPTSPIRIDKVYPSLRVSDAVAAIDFYARAFGAEEIFRLTEPGGRIGHAEMNFGPAVVMLSDEYPEYGILGPPSPGGAGTGLHLQVDDVDAATKRAVEAGATLVMEPKEQFYGERSSRLLDPFGHQWTLSQHVEDMSYEEMQRRFTAMFDA